MRLHFRRKSAPPPIDKGDLSEGAFSGARPPCDLIMKGGVASGVVYPLAVLELARKYRFERIGGTSVGAIAAAFSAAAEYARNSGGFQRLADIPDFLSDNLSGLFQPEPEFTDLFRVSLARRKNVPFRKLRLIGVALREYRLQSLLFCLPGFLALAVHLTAPAEAGWGWGVLAGVLLLLGCICGTAYGVLRDLFVNLPAHNFGMCSGRTQPNAATPGLTDWLVAEIDRIAGRPPDGRPLTFGDLKTCPEGPIMLRMVTTNLSIRRPHVLPFAHRDDSEQESAIDRSYLFRRVDFMRLFPRRVVDVMTQGQSPLKADAGQAPLPFDDLYAFPYPENLPVAVAVRMSLSAPMLIQAVPLYQRDLLLRAPRTGAIRKCLFSDGAIASNFPVHFFDAFLPNTPTFAISLDQFDRDRHGDPACAPRVELVRDYNVGRLLPISTIDTLPGFFASIAHSASQWQDNLHSRLPGARDRIAEIALTADEGGLNLTMDGNTVRQLIAFGRQAGVRITSDFDFEMHRWRRFLNTVDTLDTLLRDIAEEYTLKDANGEDIRTFALRYGPVAAHLPQGAQAVSSYIARFETLIAVADTWRADPLDLSRFPQHQSKSRITPKM